VSGAGFIMRDCHLVAYRQAGFNPVAIASRNLTTPVTFARQREIPRVHDSIVDLSRRSGNRGLDVAVPPDVQPDILRAAAKHAATCAASSRKKPLGHDYREAKECVDLCAQAGITLAVNQNIALRSVGASAEGLATEGRPW